MQAEKTETDVLIAGAGPTGSALAGELRRRGISPLIIDRQPAGANTSRACVVHARTMEVLEPLGASRDLLAQGLKVPIFRDRDRAGVVRFLVWIISAALKPKAMLVAENLCLRQQLLVVPTGNPKRLTTSRKSVDGQPDGRALRVHLVRYSRAVPIAAGIASRNPRSSSPAQYSHRRSGWALGKIDRLVFCGLYRLSPTVLDALKILQPETVIRLHRAGFRAYWRWRSRPRSGRPRIPADIRHPPYIADL